MIFRNDNHGGTFEKEIKYHKGCSRRFAAALFLLTADTRLWLQAENHVGSHEIDIAAIKPRRLDGMAYVCYMLARDIITGSRTVAVTELADSDLMSPPVLHGDPDRHAYQGLWTERGEPAHIQNSVRRTRNEDAP